MGKERVSIPAVKFLAEGVQQEIKPPDSDKGKGCWFLEWQEGEEGDMKQKWGWEKRKEKETEILRDQ